MIESLLGNLNLKDLLFFGVLAIGGYFGIRIASLKSKLGKEALRASKAEADLQLSELEMLVEEARQKALKAEDGYRHPSDS